MSPEWFEKLQDFGEEDHQVVIIGHPSRIALVGGVIVICIVAFLPGPPELDFPGACDIRRPIVISHEQGLFRPSKGRIPCLVGSESPAPANRKSSSRCVVFFSPIISDSAQILLKGAEEFISAPSSGGSPPGSIFC